MITLTDITKKPLNRIGLIAGICWDANTDNTEANVKRAISCIKSGHGRVMEYVEVTMVISNYSARCMREIYTHIAGASRLQASTRYIDYESEPFPYYIPSTINSRETTDEYCKAMQNTAQSLEKLSKLGVSKQDCANLLPLGMQSKMVWKMNLRGLINFFNKRLCKRALPEMQSFAKELKEKLRNVDEEWTWIADNLFVPQCEQYKYRNNTMCFCTEAKGCGRYPSINGIECIVKEKSECDH